MWWIISVCDKLAPCRNHICIMSFLLHFLNVPEISQHTFARCGNNILLLFICQELNIVSPGRRLSHCAITWLYKTNRQKTGRGGFHPGAEAQCCDQIGTLQNYIEAYPLRVVTAKKLAAVTLTRTSFYELYTVWAFMKFFLLQYEGGGFPRAQLDFCLCAEPIRSEALWMRSVKCVRRVKCEYDDCHDLSWLTEEYEKIFASGHG